MSHPSTPPHFRSFFDAALQDYEKQTGTSLADHPFAKQLESCDSVESITAFFQEQAQGLSEIRGNDNRIMRPLKTAVSILYTLSTSTVLGEAIGLVRQNALMNTPRPTSLKPFIVAVPTRQSDICWHRHSAHGLCLSEFIHLYTCNT